MASWQCQLRWPSCPQGANVASSVAAACSWASAPLAHGGNKHGLACQCHSGPRHGAGPRLPVGGRYPGPGPRPARPAEALAIDEARRSGTPGPTRSRGPTRGRGPPMAMAGSSRCAHRAYARHAPRRPMSGAKRPGPNCAHWQPPAQLGVLLVTCPVGSYRPAFPRSKAELLALV